METKKINVKKIISYLLIFTVFFTTVQMGSIKKVSASGITQVTGLIFHLGDTTGDVKVIDGNATDGYICEYLDMGPFTLEAESGYTITSVTSSNSSKMTINQGTTGKIFTVSSITDYSDFTLTVIMTDSAGNSVTYPIKMKFESDASLQFGTLKVTYDSNDPISIPYTQTDSDGNYTMNAAATVKTAKIELVDSAGTLMTFTVNDASSNVVTLVGGENVINITRTYLNTSKQYKLIITKKGEAKLQTLVPSTGTLSPTFNSDTYDYEMTVLTTDKTITFIPTAVDNSSTIKVDGVNVTSGKKSQNIKLDEGENEIEITLTTKDGDTSTYTVNVTRTELFRSDELTALTLTQGTLTPTFNKGVYEYTAIVENSTTSIGVTPTAEDSAATITVAGKKVPSGATSSYISLDEGGNTINVKVTDTKGNSNTYVLNVTRRYSEKNVNLSSLSVTDGTISPKFDPETYLYSVKVAKNIEKVKILYSSQNDKAKIKINGIEYTNGQSDSIKLDIGANLATVEVTAEDGTTTTTYKLSIIRGDIEATNQWVLVAGEWTFYNAVGLQIKNQWVKYDNQWYFLDINGHLKTGWILESTKWYYLNKDGIMQTGWFYDKGYWYYLQGDGSMIVNTWTSLDGKLYYFNQYGELQTGWLMYLSRWYYMDEHGIIQKGWITYDKNRYYMNDDGTMKTGWFYSGKVWYYLDESGKMTRGWQTINDKKYYFDANGVMKTGMMFLDGQWINLNNV